MLNNRLSNRFFSVTLILSLIFPAALSIGFNLYLDPFEIFSIDNKNPNVFLGGRGRDRYQHAGTLRQHKPKSVVIGNSYAANFLPTQLELNLDWKEVYSITLDGSSLHEQSRVLHFGLKHSNMGHVLWLASPSIFSAPFDYLYPKLPFPGYLYNNNHLDDLQLYATLPNKIMEYSQERAGKIKKVSEESQRIGSTVDPRDRSTEWYSLHHRQFGRANYVASRIFNKAKITQEDISVLTSTELINNNALASATLSPLRQINFGQNMTYNILPLIQDHPQTQFTFVIHPPFPLLFWQHLKSSNPGEYLDQLLTIRKFVELISSYPNADAFGFGTIKHTWNLELYKDATHYHPTVNAAMTSKISMRENMLNEANISDYLQRFDSAVTRYRPGQQPNGN